MIYRESERLILRSIEEKDTQDVYEYASDEEVVKYLTFPLHTSIEDTKEVMRNFFLSRNANGYRDATCIELKETGEMIGMCEFHSTKITDDVGEIGYVIKKKYWGKGYMPEAVQLLLNVGFNEFNLRKIIIGHAVENTKSQRVIEKSGFHFEGILRQDTKDGFGNYHDKRVYSMLKEEYGGLK